MSTNRARARTVIVRALFMAALGCARADEGSGPVFPELVDMVLVPADPSDRGETGRAFFVDRYEVTNGDYRAFVEKANYQPEERGSFLRHWPQDATGGPMLHGAFSRDWRDTPVRWVNFDDAHAYAAFVGKRLPTAAEWARAARNERYPWGRHFHRYYCNVLATGIGHPTAVGTFEEGRSPVGCYDIVGNVWEWTTTRVSSWDGTVLRDASDGESFYLIRGGSFMDPAGRGAETDHARVDAPPTRLEAARNRNAALGFRCVLDATPFIEGAFLRLDRSSTARREAGFAELLAFGEPLWDLIGRMDAGSAERQIWARAVDPGTTLAGVIEQAAGSHPEIVLVQEDGRVLTVDGRDGQPSREFDLLGMIESRLAGVGAGPEQRPRLVDSVGLTSEGPERLWIAFTWRLDPAPQDALWWWDTDAPAGRAGLAVLDVGSGRLRAFLSRPATRCDVIAIEEGARLLVQMRDPPRAGAWEPRIEDAELLGPFPGRADRRVLGPPAHRHAEVLVVDARSGQVTGSLRLPRSDVAALDRGAGRRALSRAADGSAWLLGVSEREGPVVVGARSPRDGGSIRLLPVTDDGENPLVLVAAQGDARARVARWYPERDRLEVLTDLVGLDPESVEIIEPVRVAGRAGLMIGRRGEVVVIGLDPPRVVYRRAVPSLPRRVEGPGLEQRWATYRDKGGVSLLDLNLGTVRQRVIGPVLDQVASDLDGDGQIDLCAITLEGPRLAAISMRPASSTRGRLLARFLQQREERQAGGP